MTDAATAFDDEAVLVLSEIDPALNNSANPAAFDMRNFAPKYFLINGKAYPATDPIASAAGNKVLLRYVNAGIQQHSMAVLGLRQNFVAKDASLLPTLNHNVAAETLAPGQTGDAIATDSGSGDDREQVRGLRRQPDAAQQQRTPASAACSLSSTPGRVPPPPGRRRARVALSRIPQTALAAVTITAPSPAEVTACRVLRSIAPAHDCLRLLTVAQFGATCRM